MAWRIGVDIGGPFTDVTGMRLAREYWLAGVLSQDQFAPARSSPPPHLR